jgi:large subunit ribosomal protein L10
MAIRRELSKALQKIDDAHIAAGLPSSGLAQGIKVQIIQTGIFSAALRIIEHYNPAQNITSDPLSPSIGDGLTHTLSKAAHEAIEKKSAGPMQPLLSGPLALLTFPNVSPEHLKAALTILSPQAPKFPAPTRKANPGWHDPPCQAAVQKLLLLGARVEGRTFDVEDTRWVGGLDGGVDTLRAQLVGLLQGLGAGITNALEGVGRSVYFTVEGRRMMLEDEVKPKEEVKEEVK